MKEVVGNSAPTAEGASDTPNWQESMADVPEFDERESVDQSENAAEIAGAAGEASTDLVSESEIMTELAQEVETSTSTTEAENQTMSPEQERLNVEIDALADDMTYLLGELDYLKHKYPSAVDTAIAKLNMVSPMEAAPRYNISVDGAKIDELIERIERTLGGDSGELRSNKDGSVKVWQEYKQLTYLRNLLKMNPSEAINQVEDEYLQQYVKYSNLCYNSEQLSAKQASNWFQYANEANTINRKHEVYTRVNLEQVGKTVENFLVPIELRALLELKEAYRQDVKTGDRITVDYFCNLFRLKYPVNDIVYFGRDGKYAHMGGGFQPGTNSIHLPDDIPDGSIDNRINTCAHELFHAQQRHTILYGVKDERQSYLIVNNYARIKAKVDVVGYYNQFEEKEAYLVGDTVSKLLNIAESERSANNLSVYEEASQKRRLVHNAVQATILELKKTSQYLTDVYPNPPRKDSHVA